MKLTVPYLKKAIRRVLQEHIGPMTPGEDAEYELAYNIAVKLMYTPHYSEKQVADEMSGGLYSRDPNFKLLVDRMYESLEDEASGP